jgi:transposase
MINENPNKSDAVDARMLAELGSTHPDLLHPVRVRSEETSAHLARLRARENLVQARTQLVNAARGLVKALGHRLPKCSTESFPRKARAARPRILAPALDPMFVAIAQLTRQIRAMDRDIERLCRERYAKETARLLEVHGVGALTALAFVLVVGDAARFARARDVGAFLGLVPRRDQSSDGDPQLPITKCGDAMLRRLLVQGAHFILGPFGKDCDLRRWGLARSERGGKNAKRRTVVAVARRLAVLLLTLWKRDVAYEPLHNAGRSAA